MSIRIIPNQKVLEISYPSLDTDIRRDSLKKIKTNNPNTDTNTPLKITITVTDVYKTTAHQISNTVVSPSVFATATRGINA